MPTKRKRAKAINGKIRKNFRLPANLVRWAEDYVRRKNTNLTQLIVDHLTDLKENE